MFSLDLDVGGFQSFLYCGKKKTSLAECMETEGSLCIQLPVRSLLRFRCVSKGEKLRSSVRELHIELFEDNLIFFFFSFS